MKLKELTMLNESFLTDKKAIDAWAQLHLKAQFRGFQIEDGPVPEYAIRDDGTLDVEGDVVLQAMNLYKLPVKFGKVTGSFMINNNKLNSMEGCPTYVGKNFNAYSNKFTSLDFCPREIGKDANLNFNLISTLTSKTGSISASHIYLNRNKLTSLSGIQDVIESCQLLDLGDCPWTSGGIGLLQIRDLDTIDINTNDRALKNAVAIFEKHLKGDKDVFACQQELIDAEFEAFAEL